MRIRYSFSSRRTGYIEGRNDHKQTFPKLVREVIATSDIILEILDARFLKETRNPDLEKLILDKKKKIIYVLNKSDLVDIKKTKEKIQELELFPYAFVSCKDRKGGKDLRNRIKILAKNVEFKNVRVGVIGYPNTGKSSVINLLIGKASAKTAPQAGFTRGIQKIKLSEGIGILDTPGVIPDMEQAERFSIKHAEISARSHESVKDPEMVVYDIMKKYPGFLENFYKIETEGDSEILIEKLGRKMNFLKKGNKVDVDRTARLILKDWQEGRIKI